MIFYFSGTGNSYHVAKKLAEGFGESVVDMAKAVREKQYAYTLPAGEKLGFVFPVHAWAPPKMVEDFVQRLELYYQGDLYTYAVCTCGQSAGDTIPIFDAALRANGLHLQSGYSVIMPDNYAVLFRAPSAKEAEKILQHADDIIQLIIRAVKLERKNFFRVKKGKGGVVLSNVVNPLFRRFATKTKSFHVTKDCIHCGLCAKTCLSGCIEMHKGKPIWTQPQCYMCMACLQHCPTEAIQYGKGTKNKGRYVYPKERDTGGIV